MNQKTFRLISLTLLLATALTCRAQEDEDYNNKNWADISVGLSGDAWNWELGYRRMLLPWIGVGASLQLDHEIGDGGLIKAISYMSDDFNYEDDDDGLSRLSLIPAMTLRTPVIPLLRNQDPGDGIIIQAEPGIMLSIPVNDSEYVPDWNAIPQPSGSHFINVPTVKVRNEGGHWLYWRMRLSLCYRNGPGMFQVGYAVSNYSIYDPRRNMRLNGSPVYHFTDRPLTHWLFLSLAYSI